MYSKAVTSSRITSRKYYNAATAASESTRTKKWERELRWCLFNSTTWCARLKNGIVVARAIGVNARFLLVGLQVRVYKWSTRVSLTPRVDPLPANTRRPFYVGPTSDDVGPTWNGRLVLFWIGCRAWFLLRLWGTTSTFVIFFNVTNCTLERYYNGTYSTSPQLVLCAPLQWSRICYNSAEKITSENSHTGVGVYLLM